MLSETQIRQFHRDDAAFFSVRAVLNDAQVDTLREELDARDPRQG